MAISSTLSATSRKTPVPYDIRELLIYWEWEFTQGAGYFNPDNLFSPIVVTTAPATVVFRPINPLQFAGTATNGWAAAGRCSISGMVSYVRIFNLAETIWAKLEGDNDNDQTVFTCSDGALDFTDAWGAQHYYNDYYRGILSVTNNLLKIIVNNYWTASNQDYSNNQTSQSVTLPFTQDSEYISHEVVFQMATAGNYNPDHQYFTLPTAALPTLFAFSYVDVDLSFDTLDMGDMDADQDNDTAPPIVVFLMDENGETYFESHWEYNINAYIDWNTSWCYLYDPSHDDVWAAKLKWPVSLGSRTYIGTTRNFYGSLVLMNEDGSKWFRFGQEIGYLYEIKDSKGLYDYSGEYVSNMAQMKVLLTDDYSISVTMDHPLYYEQNDYDLLEIFAPGEPLYLAMHVLSTAPYQYFLGNITIATYNAAPNVALGQTASNTIFDQVKHLTLEENEYPDKEFYLYFKDKIRNSLDYSDLDSLYAIDPGYASDAFNSLKAGEVCIVIDRYRRIYFYIVKSGYHVDALPNYIRITDSLYWELMEVIQNEEMIVEQYDIVGLITGTDKLITHTAHNRSKSYAPSIQLLHNGAVKTSDIVVSVVSVTQLRLSTDEAVAFTNLKANVYVTV